MIVYIFGNGNIKYSDFHKLYVRPIDRLLKDGNVEFIICDFRGLDTLVMEYLKSETKNVSVIHIGDKPRYIPDKFKTKVNEWQFIGDFKDDKSRDDYAIDKCTHFIAFDFNSNSKRVSGTLRNIEQCETLGKIKIDE